MKELIEKIKSKGYWRVVIRPTVYKDNLISDLSECKNIIEKSRVRLRGWDYPHIDREGIKSVSSNSVASECDWLEGSKFEYWRFYKTGQFVHYFSMDEDLRISEERKQQIQEIYHTESEKFLSILPTLYSATEIFEFSARLIDKFDIESTFEIIIELHGVKDRMLFFWDAFGRRLHNNYICHFDNNSIKIKKLLSKNDILEKSSSHALDVAVEIFKDFDWEGVHIDMLQEEQKKFLERRIS